MDNFFGRCELGRLGYREHYALAGDMLNRVVPSLAALSTAERDLVREYAYGQLGLIVGGGRCELREIRKRGRPTMIGKAACACIISRG